MFISRIEIAWNAVRNPYDIHRRIWALFPGEPEETRSGADAERQGFLYRMEDYSPGRLARILVQSRRAPVATEGIALLGTREFDPQPAPGQRLAFLLTANPIKTIEDHQMDDKPGKRSAKVRVPLVKEETQREWLVRKLEPGAAIENATVLQHAPVYFRKGSRAGKIVPVTYEGVLRVGDAEQLRAGLVNGIGPAKAFGCGLLLVRRLG